MVNFIKSAIDFAVAMPLFAAEQMRNLLFPVETPRTNPNSPVDRGRLKVARLIVLGEGLAAGMGDFSLNADTQRNSFPAQMARQMQFPLAQPLMQAPGLGRPPGFPSLPVVLPAALQTTVLEQFPSSPLSNLSVPGFTLDDSLHRSPVAPLVHRNDARQTMVNLAWGALPLVLGEKEKLATQLEYAVQQQPALTLIELGYSEALNAAVNGDPAMIPDAAAFRADYQRLLADLAHAGAQLIVLTIPDPIDAAYFATVELAGKLLKTGPRFIVDTYAIDSRDLISANGLNEIGFQLFAKTIGPLPDGSTLSQDTASRISDKVAALNAEIHAAGNELSAHVYDLHAFFKRLRRAGLNCGNRTLTAEYLGGFYSLNGFYPGATGQACLANELLHLINNAYGARFPQIDVQDVMRHDPVAQYRQAAGPDWSAGQLATGLQRNAADPSDDDGVPSAQNDPAPALNEDPLSPADPSLSQYLELPPGLEQVLPLSLEASYFGDGIAALNGQDPQGIQWGSSGNWLFGGLAMVDSHLRGSIRIKFSPPKDNLSHFEISLLSGLIGDDAVLVTPQYFKMAFQRARVDDVPGNVSSGTLNLATGDVTDLKIYARYSSTALLALVGVNPTFPRQPLSFPGQYGSAWAKFEQRADGKLDFVFYGSTFVPLGQGIVWPLNFVGPSQQFATVPANGTVMHPHLHLSTKQPIARTTENPPDFPFNTVQELTLHTHNSSFGDAFTLDTPDLGGPAKGRSHVLGRVQIQFGPRCGNSVPVAISHLDAGGLLNEMASSPITEAFPGRLYHGPRGFNELLRFPLRTYSLDDLSIFDDPFDISMGMVDLKTGRMINELLHRGFINQDLIFALLRVEPRTPKDSFYFRGPAVFEKGVAGALRFRFQGVVRVPYPEGFLFPKPNLTTGFPIGPESVLDPFLWIRAIQDDAAARFVKEGSASNVLSSTGEYFSYRYRISSDPGQEAAFFEYENISQEGAFRLHSLSWVGFSNSRDSVSATGDYDTVTFTGFGIWSKDNRHSLQQIAVQISTCPTAPYVGIQVGSGDISDVNTKPENEQEALP